MRYPPTDTPARGYLARASAGTGPGLLVIQEWWGLVDHIKQVTDRFAGAGFTALAPDFYDRQTTKSRTTPPKLFMALNIDRAAGDLRGAADYLLSLDAATSDRVGVIGFCMGGQLALYAAVVAADRVGAVVDFYGIHPNVPIDPAKVRAPVLGHFGTRDGSIPLPKVRQLAADVRAAGGSFVVHEYEADHAFFNDTRPTVFQADAAKLAWERSLEFLRANL
ncbi:MAG: dienelactone hydrolase family protein [Gemmatimonadales bacterium]